MRTDSPGDPDPTGLRVRVVRHALDQLQYIEGLFWECVTARPRPCDLVTGCLKHDGMTIALCVRSFASLHQKPRSAEQTDAFIRALKQMGDLYASPIGTTVLQLKETPPRPQKFDGALCLFGLAEGVDEAAIRKALHGMGEITNVSLGGTLPILRFKTHGEAVKAASLVASNLTICAAMSTQYNERPYDDRGW